MTEVVLAIVLGLLFALGTFLVLQRDVVRVVWGVVIISQATNVYLVTMGGIGGSIPIIGHGDSGHAGVTDPLVQALVLTAIVIGFGTTAFALVLTYRLYEEHGTLDLEKLDSLQNAIPEGDEDDGSMGGGVDDGDDGDDGGMSVDNGDEDGTDEDGGTDDNEEYGEYDGRENPGNEGNQRHEAFDTPAEVNQRC